jgi:hypothetical protein
MCAWWGDVTDGVARRGRLLTYVRSPCESYQIVRARRGRLLTYVHSPSESHQILCSPPTDYSSRAFCQRSRFCQRVFVGSPA